MSKASKAKVVYIDENGVVKNPKFEEFKEKVKNAKNWVKNHSEETIAIASIAIPAAIEAVKIIAKNSERREETNRREKEIWDPVEGHWWHLRRPLTVREQLLLEERVRAGDSRGKILESMGVLKL